MIEKPSPPSGSEPSRRREFAFRAVLVLFSLGVTMLFAEAALRLAVPSPAAAVAEEDDGFSFFTYDERLGWDLVPGTADRHQSSEFDVTIRINSHGLRSDREYALEKSPGTQRIVVIGDSFLFGHGVDAAEALPALLESRLDGSEVINLSVTGYGTDQQLLRLQEQGFRWNPDIVLLGLFEGNIFRNARTEYLGYPKPRFVQRGGSLELINVPVPEEPSRPGFLQRTRLWQLFGGRGADLLEHLGFGEAWPTSRAILTRLRDVCAENGSELRVVVLPKDQAVYGSGLRRAVHDRALAKIDRMLEDLDIEHLDLTAPLVDAAAQGQPLYFPLDGHWTAEAHRVAAREVAEWLAASSAFTAAHSLNESQD